MRVTHNPLVKGGWIDEGHFVPFVVETLRTAILSHGDLLFVKDDLRLKEARIPCHK